MSRLTSDTVLRRIPDLDLHLDADGRVTIDLGARKVHCPRHALAVLAEFSTPRTMAGALAALERSVQGVEDWKLLTATISGLHEAGVLRDASQRQPSPRRPAAGFAAAPVHIRMLNDRARTEGFLAAIRRVVRPGDVVVDLGTGTGILAVAAARAGARHVYAIEHSDIGESAAALFAANGLAERITLVRGWSTEIHLPERGDVLISEVIGNEPLEEQILSVTADARKRLLKPGARLIPEGLTIFGLPVTVPRKKLKQNTFEEAPLASWQSWYGVDFGALADSARGRPRCFSADPLRAREWSVLSAGVELVRVDLEATRGGVFRETAATAAAAAGFLSGVLEYFEAELAPGVRLSTRPDSVETTNSWRCPVWILPEGLSLEAGDRFAVTYSRKATDVPDGITVTRLPV